MLLNTVRREYSSCRCTVDSPASAGHILCLGFIACVLGCQGANSAEVAGRVTFDGKPLHEGLVTFRPTAETAGPEFSGKIVNGEYRVVKSVLPGTYVVQVRSWQKTGRIVESPYGGKTEEIIDIIPKRYQAPGGELSRVLASGTNAINFDLTN